MRGRHPGRPRSAVPVGGLLSYPVAAEESFVARNGPLSRTNRPFGAPLVRLPNGSGQKAWDVGSVRAPAGRRIAMSIGFLDRERIVAPPGWSRWLIPPAALSIHLAI